MNVTVTGADSLIKSIRKNKRLMNRVVDDAVVLTANEIQNQAIQSISKQTRGDKKIKRGNKFHYPSPKGSAPNTDKGGLVQSIQLAHVNLSKTAMVFSNLNYAAYLEFVLDRPWLKPASEGKAKVLRNNILDLARKALK